MKRPLAALTTAALLGLALAAPLAPAAHAAVTNPADNPHPITVKGDDGRTYTDGEDTLPGYDDVECTYIPGAWFDFDNNRVHYADGQSIPWTEWERASGYDEWKAKQAKGTSASSAPSTAAGGTTKSTTPTRKPSAKPTPKPAAKPSAKPTTTASAPASPTAAPTATASAGESAAALPSDAATPGESIAAVPTDTAVDAAVDGGISPVAASDGDTTEAVAATSGGSLGAGLGIVGGLAAAAGLLLVGNAVYRRRSRKEPVQ